MAVKIRLARRGRKKLAMYDVIVADARSPRDGRIIEKLGTYNPLTNPATILIKEDRALDWLLKGAQPTDTVRRILSHKGVMFKKHLQVGVLKEAITQEQADKKFEDWLKGKEAEISGNIDSITKKKADVAKARLEAEKKVNEAKAEALKKKLAALVPAEETETSEEEVTEAPVVEAATEEVIVEEKKAEAPAKEELKEEAPVEAPKAEETKAEEKVEEPKVEASEKPVAEKEKVPAEKAPVEEAKAEEKVEEPKVEASEKPVAEKEEVPAEKTPVEEAKAEEKVEEPKAETTKKPVDSKEEAPTEKKKKEEEK